MAAPHQGETNVTSVRGVWLTYARVSSEEAAELGYSIASQARTCKERALEMGATEVEEYVDEGVPGDIINRPAMMALRSRIRQGGVVGLVCYDPDRLARDLAYQLVLADEFAAAGVRLEFINHEYRDTDEGRLFFQIRGAIAEYERRKIVERTQRGKREKAMKGLIPGAYRCYGYVLDSGRLLVSPEQSAWVGQIFAWCVNDHRGSEAIARRLNDLGVPSGTGRPWSRQAVHYMLTNATYTGELVLKYDQSGVRKNRFRADADKVHKRLRPEEEWIRIQVPALVPTDLWNAAQSELKKTIRPKQKHSYPYLLSGMMECGLCGSFIRGKVMLTGRKKPKKPVPYYICSKRHIYPPDTRPRCTLPSVQAELAEAMVWNKLEEIRRNPASLLELMDEQQPMDVESLRLELKQVQTEMESAQAERQEYIRMRAKQYITDAELDAYMKDIVQRLRRLTSRRTELEILIAQRPDIEAVQEHVRRTERRIDLAMHDPSNVDLRRQTIREIFEKLVLLDGDLKMIARHIR